MSTSGPTLRPAAESDVPTLIEVARRAWLSAFAQTAPFEILQAWFQQNREPSWYAVHWAAMTVGLLDGAVVGLIQPAGDQVNGLWVLPAVHSRGVGTALLLHAERQIRQAGHSRSWLTCSAYNRSAERFYLARGYRTTRRMTEQFGGIAEPMLVMEKLLPAEETPDREAR